MSHRIDKRTFHFDFEQNRHILLHLHAVAHLLHGAKLCRFLHLFARNIHIYIGCVAVITQIHKKLALVHTRIVFQIVAKLACFFVLYLDFHSALAIEVICY